MKKYFITAVAALSLGGLFTSCTHDVDGSSSSGDVAQNAQESYEQAFLNTFGRPVEGFDWGFGSSSATASSRALTRAIPTKPTFSSQTDVAEPTSSKPALSTTVYNTVAAAKQAGVTVIDAKSKTITVDNNSVIEINSSSTLNELGNRSGVVAYLGENMTSLPSFNQNNINTVVVPEDKTLTLSGISQNLEIYLAPRATLTFTGDIGVERGFHLYMSSGSTFVAQGVHIKNGSWILNHGGTITIGTEQNKKSLNLENNCILWNEDGGENHGSVTIHQDLSTVNDYGVIYNASNCSISASNLSLNKYVTLWDAGTITITNEMKCVNEDNKVRTTNTGRLEVGSLNLINNYDLLINEGTLVSGAIKLHNTGAELVNFGTLQGTSMEVGAGSLFHNAGPAVMSGKTYINNTSCKWMNDDSYTCTEFEIDGGSNSTEPFVFNNCKLIVNGKFKQTHGYFVLDGGNKGGAYVYCQSFDWTGDNYFLMGSKSLLEVRGQLLGANRNSAPEYGFHGEGGADGYAVIKAGSIAKDSEGKYRMAYYGYLYIDTSNHFEQGQASDGPWYYHGTNVQFSFTDEKDANVVAVASPVSIPETDCSPGYSYTPPTPPVTPVTDAVRVIAEDLTTLDGKADFDFNDVVFDVVLLSSGKVRITLQAAGGTLPLTVGDPTTELQSPTMEMQKDSQGNDMEEVMKYEVHRLFKVATTTMVNTNAAGGANRDAVAFEIDNPISSTDAKEIANAIPIRVYKNGQWIELAKAVPVTGTATITASKLAVDGTFGWCAERVALEKDSRYQYTDDAGNNLGSRFRMYLEGRIEGDWWLSTTKAKN
jgi:hypothetical protein